MIQFFVVCTQHVHACLLTNTERNSPDNQYSTGTLLPSAAGGKYTPNFIVHLSSELQHSTCKLNAWNTEPVFYLNTCKLNWCLKYRTCVLSQHLQTKYLKYKTCVLSQHWISKLKTQCLLIFSSQYCINPLWEIKPTAAARAALPLFTSW